MKTWALWEHVTGKLSGINSLYLWSLVGTQWFALFPYLFLRRDICIYD